MEINYPFKTTSRNNNELISKKITPIILHPKFESLQKFGKLKDL